MTPYQKRIITVICKNNIGYENMAAIMLDFDRGRSKVNVPPPHRLGDVPRKEIIAYAHERTGMNKARLNTEMDERESPEVAA
jgi:hypothetical protein